MLKFHKDPPFTSTSLSNDGLPELGGQECYEIWGGEPLISMLSRAEAQAGVMDPGGFPW